MRKISLIFGILISVTEMVISQDIIIKKNGEIIEGKVLEITETSVKYHKQKQAGGPVYSINKSLILKIKYENGKEEEYTSPTTQSNILSEEEIKKLEFDSIIKKKKNIIGMDIAQFIYTSAGLSYERFFGKNSKFSIRIPFSFGFYYIGNDDNIVIYDKKYQNSSANQDDNYYAYIRGKIFGGSFELNYYPLGMGKIKYFVGPYFEYGVFAYKIRIVEEIYDPNYYYWQTKFTDFPVRYDGQHVAGGINNGFIIHINPIFTLTGTFGLGLKKDETPIAGDKILTQAKFNFIFGIKF